MELDYTRELEEALDAIATGSASYLPVVTEAHAELAAEIGEFVAATPSHLCPACDKPLQRRQGKTPGSFWWGCTGFPECKTTFPDEAGVPSERTPLNKAEFVYFDVPFASRDKAKKLSMRYDGARKAWYAPSADIAKAASAVRFKVLDK